jgi:EpsI family protein
MIDRRDLLFGGSMAAAFATAQWLRPRRTLDLLHGADLEKIVPRRFAGWSSAAGGDFIVPQTPASLAARLYTRQLMRSYAAAGGPPVMLVMAYGSSQSDALQLHRPESCYAAVGFSIGRRRLIDIPVAPGVTIPAVTLSAAAEGRTEDIIYWTRLGEGLPQTAQAQRAERLRAAMAGVIGDGVLVRASMTRIGDTPDFARLQSFLQRLVLAMPVAARESLIGTARAQALRLTS